MLYPAATHSLTLDLKGPWLQLPLELLESLLVLNIDPTTLSAPETRQATAQATHALPSVPSNGNFFGVDYSPSSSPPDATTTSPPQLPPPPPPAKARKPTPPPIDPGVFRSVISIRRLIDEASDLAVRAASGLSAAALGSLRSCSTGSNASAWATAQSLGINLFGEQTNGGRSVNMSATRAHRLRALAVQRLAAAYKADEIAASVMVMQGASALDDIAERVLKVGKYSSIRFPETRLF